MRELSSKSVDVARRMEALCRARKMTPEEQFDVAAILVALSSDSLPELIERAKELKEQIA